MSDFGMCRRYPEELVRRWLANQVESVIICARFDVESAM